MLVQQLALGCYGGNDGPGYMQIKQNYIMELQLVTVNDLIQVEIKFRWCREHSTNYSNYIWWNIQRRSNRYLGYANTETWNGTNWTEVNDLNTGRTNISGNGTTTSALGFGSDTGPSQIANTESWNGTNWTEVNDLNQARSPITRSCELIGDSNTTGLALWW